MQAKHKETGAVVEAIQLSPATIVEAQALIDHHTTRVSTIHHDATDAPALVFHDLGEHIVCCGDWVVRVGDNRATPVSAERFKAEFKTGK